jgi:hypothetical protein
VQPLPRMQTLQLSNTPEQPVKQGKLERVLLAVPVHGVQVVAPLVTAPVPLPTSATEPTGHAEQLVCPLWVWNRSVGQGLHGTEERGENWPAGQAEQLVAALLTAPVATRYTPVQLLSHGGRWPEHPDAKLAVELISKHWKSSNELELSSVPYMRGLC